MPAAATRADALRLHLSGAASHLAAQADPDLSLGNYRSPTELAMLGHTVTSPIWGIEIAFVPGSLGVGSHTLTASGADSLRFAASGGTLGTAVTLYDGDTAIVEDGSDPSKYLRVTRTSSETLAGTATVTTAGLVNGLVGMDDVSSPERAAGDDEQRGLFLVNASAAALTAIALYVTPIGTARVSASAQLGASGAGTLAVSSGDFSDWDEAGFCRIEQADGTLREIVYYASRTATALTVPAAGRERLGTSAAAGAASDVIRCVPGIRLALETPSDPDDGFLTNCADEGTIPGGLTWSAAISAATAVCALASLAAGQHHGLRIRREIPAGMTATPLRSNLFAWTFDSPS